MIILAEKSRENKRLLAIENIGITAMAKIAIVLSIINLGNKHSRVISNGHINRTKNLGLTNIKNY